MKGYQIMRKHSPTGYVILCQRIGNGDPIELFQANVGISNVVVDLHYYNLFDPYFASMTSTQNIEFIYKKRAPQLQALSSLNGPLFSLVNGLTNGTCRTHRRMNTRCLAKLSLMFMRMPPLGGRIGHLRMTGCTGTSSGIFKINTYYSVVRRY